MNAKQSKQSKIDEKNQKDIPITCIFRRRIVASKFSEFDAWSKNIAASCKKFKGYSGIKVIRPQNPEDEIITILTFDSYRNFEAWENSNERVQWLDAISDITVSEGNSEYIRGFDYWFAKRNSWPPDFRMVLIAFLAIWPLVFFLDPLLSNFMPANAIMASLVKTFIITLLMGYLSLPLMTRIFGRWL